LKAKIQAIAAAQAGKQLCYMTHDENLEAELKSSVDPIYGHTVGKILIIHHIARVYEPS
jgi:hypothetical protein